MGFLNQAADVVTEDLAQHFVDHGSVVSYSVSMRQVDIASKAAFTALRASSESPGTENFLVPGP